MLLLGAVCRNANPSRTIKINNWFALALTVERGVLRDVVAKLELRRFHAPPNSPPGATRVALRPLYLPDAADKGTSAVPG
jgi:hypothetical protein